MASDHNLPSGSNDTPYQSHDKQHLQTHTRTYQACIPCRRRKVRCDLGPVDSPHDPPCARCLRENKECYFSSTRRKRKGDEEGDDQEDAVIDDYEIRNGRKRMRASATDTSVSSHQESRHQDRDSLAEPLTPGGSVGRKIPLKRPSSQPTHSSDEDEQIVNNDTTAILQQTEVFNGQDALHLLYEAAGHNGDIKHHKTGSSGSLPEPNFQADTPKSKVSGSLGRGRMGGRSASLQGSALGGNADGTSTIPGSIGQGTDHEGLQQAIGAWSKLRFIRAGWFTSTEAIGYIDYFYRFLSPMTPITVPDYHNPARHAKLLADEPMLTVTMLAIASRYMALPGPGAVARAFAIHEKLWNFLQGMIDRMIWGQEHFGRGFNTERCGGDDGSCVTTKKGLRTFGTIESLLLLTEWHTRALHFPPGDDNDELITYGGDLPQENTKGQSGVGIDKIVTPSYRGRGIDSWLEPCWRSDRMSWSLLANAMALAYERGVFDKPVKQHASIHRSENIRKLLYIYLTQTSGRLSLPSMLPQEHVESMFQENPVEKAARIEKYRLANPSDTTDYTDLKQEVVLYFWCKIAAVMKRVNAELFPSRGHTRALITSGEYRNTMQQFGTALDMWREEFDACTMISDHLRHILNIEFQYARVYANSLGLQAVVERCTNNTPSLMLANLGTGDNAQKQSQIIPGDTLRKWMEGDRKYIKEIVLASQDLLRSIVDGLLPGGYLKHAPVRTYFRVISVSMFLLKTFALGNTEEDVALSLGLLDRAAEAMRTCIVDDVHVGSQFATLLATLTHRVRSRIVRITSKTSGSAEQSRAGSRAASPKQEVENGKPEKSSSPIQNRGSKNSVSEKPTRQQTKQENPASQSNQTFQPQVQAQVQQSRTQNPLSPLGVPAQKGPQGQTSPYLSWHEYFPGFPQQTQNDPLYGISASLYDPLHPTFSIMPPPSQEFNKNQGAYNQLSETVTSNDPALLQNTQFPTQPTVNSDSMYGGAFDSDWFALPLDPIVNSYGADVIQTGYGPELGGQDMLDLLLTDPNTNGNWQSSNTNGA